MSKERYKKALESEIRGYFPCCPLCFASKTLKINLVEFGRDTMNCERCNASWHLKIGFGFKWAELELESSYGKGRELLGKRLKGKEWQKICLEGRRKLTTAQLQAIEKGVSSPDKVIEKEIIREIVMVPCSYCSGLMPVTSTTCPHCGAVRRA